MILQKNLVSMGYYGLLTVTMGYQAGNFDRRDAEERRGKIMEGKFI
jgi:hypothetical protein